MFYVFVLGCGLVVALVVALLRGDVPAARGWTLLLIGSPVIGPIATVLAGPLGLAGRRRRAAMRTRAALRAKGRPATS